MTAPVITSPNGHYTLEATDGGTLSGGIRVHLSYVAMGVDDDKPWITKPSDLTFTASMQRLALLGELERAYMTMPINATATGTGSVATGVAVDVAGTWADDASEGFTINTSTGVITYTGAGGLFRSNVTLTGATAMGANRAFTSYFKHNTTKLLNTRRCELFDVLDTRTFNLSHQIQLATNDTLNIVVQAETVAADITFECAAFDIVPITNFVS